MNLEQTFSISNILHILRKHIVLIIFSTLLMTILSVFVTFFMMTPKYDATTQILVNRKLPSELQGAQYQQVQADVQMISTYKDIIMSPTILDKVDSVVQNEAGYPGSEEKLQKSLSIDSQQNSQVFSITATTTDPETAAKIANTTAKVFKKKVGKIMSVNNVSIVSPATAVDKPVSPRTKLNILIGVLVGLFIGIGLAFIREMGNRTVTSEAFLTNELGLTSLGIVNEIPEKDVREQLKSRQDKSNKGTNGTSGKMGRRV